MRYVIAAVSVALFLIWDGFENEGRYLAQGVWMLTRAFGVVGL